MQATEDEVEVLLAHEEGVVLTVDLALAVQTSRLAPLSILSSANGP